MSDAGVNLFMKVSVNDDIGVCGLKIKDNRLMYLFGVPCVKG